MRSLVFTAALTFIVMAGSARATPVLSVVPSASEVSVGSTVDVAITIEGLVDGASPSLGAFDVDLLFDPAILVVSGAVFGDPVAGDQLDLFGLGSLTSAGSTAAGLYNLFELSFDAVAALDSLQRDAFTLATVSFVAAAPGTSVLTLGINALSDATGYVPVNADIVNSSVTVPEPGTLALTLVGALLAVRRRRPPAARGEGATRSS